ncbi:MAG TPA: prepilin-type N-terminal cleavage/methylation domain-containing protein [Gemmatimonadaceae bacterium]|nr:prepilin-type N-terminal cleavage/methylation domain-containing protein [Gemmatimonadaceae bacterium]
MPATRAGFTLVEVLLAAVVLAIVLAATGRVHAWAAVKLRAARATTEQLEGPRRIVHQFAQLPASSLPTVATTYQFDSLSLSVVPVAATAPANNKRFAFVISAMRGAGTTRPDTFRLEFSPLITRVAVTNTGDLRP